MRFFIVFYLAIQCGWSSYNGYSSHHTLGGRSQDVIHLAPFLRSFKDMPEHIEQDWYKRDENNELVKGKNFQNNILKILIQQIVERFNNYEGDRSDAIKETLDFLNNFITERFIPGAYQVAIKKIFSHGQSLQHRPAMQVTNTVFDNLTDAAKKAFRDGVRVQTSGLDHAPTGRMLETMHADPMLVEILFMQLVWDAQKRDGSRQDLLNSIEKTMVKMEHLFSNNPDYTIVGTFPSLRSSLLEESQKESPFPDLIKYIISLVTDEKKELEKNHAELLDNKQRDEWLEITKTKASSAISVWKKKDLPPQENEDDKKKRLKDEEKKRKRLAEKESREKLKDSKIDQVKEKGSQVAQNAFDGAVSTVFSSLKGAFGGLLG